jgi:hypothetical protein
VLEIDCFTELSAWLGERASGYSAEVGVHGR